MTVRIGVLDILKLLGKCQKQRRDRVQIHSQIEFSVRKRGNKFEEMTRYQHAVRKKHMKRPCFSACYAFHNRDLRCSEMLGSLKKQRSGRGRIKTAFEGFAPWAAERKFWKIEGSYRMNGKCKRSIKMQCKGCEGQNACGNCNNLCLPVLSL